MGELLTLCTVAKPAGKRTGNFGSAESGLNHRDAMRDDHPQQVTTCLMKLVRGICRSDPHTGINRQTHGFSSRLRSCIRSSRAEGPAGARERASSAE